MRLGVLTMDFQKVLGTSLAVQLIDVLGDDHDPAALLTQPGLTLSDGEVPGVWLHALNHFPPVVVELPHQGRVLGKGLGSGQGLGVRGGRSQGGKERSCSVQSTGSGARTEPWSAPGGRGGKHWPAPLSLQWAGSSGRVQGGTRLLRFVQRGRHRAGVWAPACVPILGLTRNLGEIGFNFPNYNSEKIQPVPFDPQGSYEHEVK